MARRSVYYISTVMMKKARPAAIPSLLTLLIQALPVLLGDEIEEVWLGFILNVFEGAYPTKPGSWSCPSTNTNAIPLWSEVISDQLSW